MAKQTPIAREELGADDGLIFDSGVEEGRKQHRVKVLTFLQDKYLDKSVDRRDPIAKALLQLAGELRDALK